MNRRVPPSFFFNESDADEDLMAEKTGLDPDALWDAQCAYTKVYAPDRFEQAIAAAIKAYLAASRPDFQEFANKLAAFKAELENLHRELEEVAS